MAVFKKTTGRCQGHYSGLPGNLLIIKQENTNIAQPFPMTQSFSFTRVFSNACTGMLMFGMVIITLGSILPELAAKFQLDEVRTGTLTSLLPVGILLGSLIFGPVVDRYSYKYLLVACSILIVIGLEGIANTGNYHILQVSLLCIGVGGGAMNGGTNALVADISSGRRRSANLSFLGVFFGVGALGVPLLLGFLSKYFSHYSIVAAIGALLVLPIGFFLFTKFPEPKQKHSIPIRQSLRLLKDLNLLLLGVILFFQSGIEGIISNWSTLFLIETGVFSLQYALFALSGFVMSLTLTRIVLTFLLNRIRSYQVLVVSVLLALAGIAWLTISSLVAGKIIGLALLGAGLAAGFPIILSYVGALYPSLSGTAFGLVLALGLSGNIFFNFLMGLLSTSYGLKVYSPLLISCLLGMIMVLSVTLKLIAKRTYI